jgi:hypothetical protein
MFIIPFKGQRHSGTWDLNLLYNEGKVYLMDNHLAASWCWLQKLNITQQYNYLHIDRHYDLLDSQTDWWVSSLQEQSVNLKKISIQDLLQLKYHQEMNPNWESFPIFRWDNYLTIFNRLYPTIFISSQFATQKDGDEIDGYEINHVDSWDLHQNLSYWLMKNPLQKWVVNLDIDYFFSDYDEKHYFQLFSDEFIIRIANEIKKSMKNIKVLTVALSPEMCGGWKNSLRVCKLITDVLRINWFL